MSALRPLSLCVALCSYALITSHQVVLINATPSMPRGLWKVEALHDDSTLVSVTPPQEALAWGCVRPHQVLIKRVWAREGETICQHGRELYKESAPTRVVRTSLLARDGSLIRLGWRGCHTLKTDEVFVLGQHPSSCDSRFFGPVPTSNLRSSVTPLWIWDDLKEAP